MTGSINIDFEVDALQMLDGEETPLPSLCTHTCTITCRVTLPTST
jgi:hypothetical protein